MNGRSTIREQNGGKRSLMMQDAQMPGNYLAGKCRGNPAHAFIESRRSHRLRGVSKQTSRSLSGHGSEHAIGCLVGWEERLDPEFLQRDVLRSAQRHNRAERPDLDSVLA